MSVSIPINTPNGGGLIDFFPLLRVAMGTESQYIDFFFEDRTFITPMLSVPLCAILHKLADRGKLVSVSLVPSYLELIGFPIGLNSIESQRNADSMIELAYSPITKIATTYDDKEDDVVLSIIWNILSKHNCSFTGLRGAIAYLIGEVTDNCKQHSESGLYWIGTQLFVESRKFSICIVDLGKTVLGSYQSAGFDEVSNIKDALDAALQGKSTKMLEEGRGYGIRTSKSLLCQGLAGSYSIWSGQAVYVNKAGTESWSKLNSVYHFPGTVVSMEMPIDVPRSFNIYDYVA